MSFDYLFVNNSEQRENCKCPNRSARDAKLFLLQVRSLRECRHNSVQGTFDSLRRHTLICGLRGRERDGRTIGRVCGAEDRVSIVLENAVPLAHLPARSLSLAHSCTRDLLTPVIRALRLANCDATAWSDEARNHNFTESELRTSLLTRAPCSQPALLPASHAAPHGCEGRCAGSARHTLEVLRRKYYLAELRSAKVAQLSSLPRL